MLKDTVKVQDVKNSMDSGQDVSIIDVRTPEEYKMGHIRGSLLMPHNEIDRLIEKEVEDRTRKVFLYCRSGARSGHVLQILKSLGYTNVSNVQGGIIEWMSHGYPIEQ